MGEISLGGLKEVVVDTAGTNYKIGDACIDTNDNGETWNIAIPYITY